MMPQRCCRWLVFALLLSLTNKEAGSSWIDPDTPDSARTTTATATTTSSNAENDNAQQQQVYDLVFSDEFNVPRRTFADGHDPRWTALHRNDNTNNPLHYYRHDHVSTTDAGVLELTTDLQPRNFTVYWTLFHRHHHVTVTKEIASAMLQSWNKFCFTGGVVEYSVQLPGRSHVGGLWPAVWAMGSLARAVYTNSSERLWPFSTNACNNRTRYSQLLNSCPPDGDSGDDDDDDDERKARAQKKGRRRRRRRRGRGAPEVDLLEVMYMDLFEQPLMSVSLQVAPGVDEPHRPQPGHAPNSSQTWYEIELGNASSQNTYFYGSKVWREKKREIYQTDAISTNVYLRDDHFQHQHIYRMEWEPPSDDDNDNDDNDGSNGYLKWFLDGQLIATVHGDTLQATSQTEIPSEPMYLIMNTAISKDWGFPDAYFLNCSKKCWSCFDPACHACALPAGFCDNFPATMRIDHVRVYQNKNSPWHTLGCSPPRRPTADFIAAHRERYMTAGQTAPLQPVTAGGGVCVGDTECGNSLARGYCSSSRNVCQCQASWTGPYCRAHAGSDDKGDDDDDDDNSNNNEEEEDGMPTVLAGLMEGKAAFHLVVWCFVGVVAIMVLSCGADRWSNRRRQYETLGDENDDTIKFITHQETMSTSPSSSSPLENECNSLDRDDDQHFEHSLPHSYQRDEGMMDQSSSSGQTNNDHRELLYQRFEM